MSKITRKEFIKKLNSAEQIELTIPIRYTYEDWLKYKAIFNCMGSDTWFDFTVRPHSKIKPWRAGVVVFEAVVNSNGRHTAYGQLEYYNSPGIKNEFYKHNEYMLSAIIDGDVVDTRVFRIY